MPVGKSYQLRILHLSDLHQRGSREAEHWRRRRALGDSWLHNLETFRAGGPIDIVCFTGDVDLADWGKSEEYIAATEFFLVTLENVEVPPERLTYRDPHGKIGNQLLYRHDESGLEIVESGRPWCFDGDRRISRVVFKVHRIRLAHPFDPLLAVIPSRTGAAPAAATKTRAIPTFAIRF